MMEPPVPSEGPPDALLDTVGLLCPLPIVETQKLVRRLAPGALVEVVSDDVGILEDMPAWCKGSGHELLEVREDGEGLFHCLVRVGGGG